jgi:hypothetical protein
VVDAVGPAAAGEGLAAPGEQGVDKAGIAGGFELPVLEVEANAIAARVDELAGEVLVTAVAWVGEDEPAPRKGISGILRGGESIYKP